MDFESVINIRNLKLGRLVKRAKRGDKTSFGRLYQETVGAIYRFILVRVRVREDAEDLTEVVYIRVLEHIGSYEERGLPFMAWIYQIARNAVIDHWRQGNKKPLALFENSAETGIEDNNLERLESFERQKIVWGAIEGLPEVYQEAVILRYIEEMSYKDISRVLNKKEGAVRVIVHRGLEKLRKALNGRV